MKRLPPLPPADKKPSFAAGGSEDGAKPSFGGDEGAQGVKPTFGSDTTGENGNKPAFSSADGSDAKGSGATFGSDETKDNNKGASFGVSGSDGGEGSAKPGVGISGSDLEAAGTKAPSIMSAENNATKEKSALPKVEVSSTKKEEEKVTPPPKVVTTIKNAAEAAIEKAGPAVAVEYASST